MVGLRDAVLQESQANSEQSEVKKCEYGERLQTWWKTVEKLKRGIWSLRTVFINKCSMISFKQFSKFLS